MNMKLQALAITLLIVAAELAFAGDGDKAVVILLRDSGSVKLRQLIEVKAAPEDTTEKMESWGPVEEHEMLEDLKVGAK
jgi:hypothetical protein